MAQFNYLLLDEFGGACRKFTSRIEAQPFLTDGMVLKALPRAPKADPYQVASTILQEAPF